MTETVLVAPAGGTDLRLAPPQPEDAEIEKAKEILPETVILTSSEAATGKSPSPGEEETKRIPSVQQMEERPFGQDFLTETVILGPARIASVSMTAGSAGSKGKAPSPAETEKTVVLAETGKEPAEEDFLAETVVVEPGKGREKKGKGNQ